MHRLATVQTATDGRNTVSATVSKDG